MLHTLSSTRLRQYPRRHVLNLPARHQGAAYAAEPADALTRLRHDDADGSYRACVAGVQKQSFQTCGSCGTLSLFHSYSVACVRSDAVPPRPSRSRAAAASRSEEKAGVSANAYSSDPHLRDIRTHEPHRRGHNRTGGPRSSRHIFSLDE